MKRTELRCESCNENPVTGHCKNPDFAGYDLCAECIAQYDSRPFGVIEAGKIRGGDLAMTDNRQVCVCGEPMWKNGIAFPESEHPRQKWICGQDGKTRKTPLEKVK